ncbi:MAG: GHKL domain-containing protein [Armatimonadetes bacterium]|nr:GHKL domain-containing protein [Armatimonadota bacterium]
MFGPVSTKQVFAWPILALVVSAGLAVWLFWSPVGPVVPAVLLALSLSGLLAVGLARRTALEEHKGAVSASALAASKELEAARERQALDGLADGLDVWILLVDRAGTILYANDKFSSVFRYPEPVGQSILAVTLSRDLASLVTESAESGEPKSREVVFEHPAERVGLARAWREGEDGDHLFVSVYDVTDLRRLERARRDFVANVSHELRTPMATIRAMAETILDDSETTNDETKRYLTKVISEVDRLTRISNDLLTLSVAESKPTQRASVDLSDLCRSAAHQTSPKAKRKKLGFTSHLDQDVIVEANPEQITQVLLNLLENAINYTSEGSVELTCRSEGDTARVEVTDTGMGIPSEHLGRIFERFYRVDKARSRETGGTGLGLSIVKHIIESHGGQAGVESRLNEGSTFWFTLPLAQE